MNEMKRVKVIGLGSDFRRDDAVGLCVVQRLREVFGARIDALEIRDPSQLLALWSRDDEIILVDAAKSGAEPGKIWRLEIYKEREVPKPMFSTHTISLQKIIDIAEALDVLPRKLVIYAVEGESFERGHGLTENVEKAANKLVRIISEELKSFLDPPSYDA